MNISYFKTINKPKGKITSLQEVINEIRTQEHQPRIDKIQSLLSRSDLDHEKRKEKTKKEKKLLPAIKPSLLTESKQRLNKTDQPTGLVQVDIDVSINPNTDMDKVFQILIDLPYTAYVFRSPTGGIKWAGQTDFHRPNDENIEDTAKRFVIAYRQTVEALSKHIDVVMDDCMKSIAALCFVGSDPNIYYNPNPKTLHLGTIEVPVKKDHEISQWLARDVDQTFFSEILSYIPKDYKHKNRMKVAWVHYENLGDDGEGLFMSHFHQSYSKLTKEWRNAKRYNKGYGHIGTLVNMAKENGYRPKTGNGRKLVKAKSSPHRFASPIPANVAQQRLHDVLEDCFTNKVSHYVSMSCGLGKTETMLDFVVQHASSMNIMICAPTGNLQHEIYNRLHEKYKTCLGDFSALRPMMNVQMTRGRLASDEQGPMCIQNDMVEGLQRIHAGLPVDECYKCPKFSACKYIRQFQDFHKVRIVTTAQYFNGPGIWDGGYKTGPNGLLPANTHFQPDIIIIDENAVQLHTIEVNNRSPFASLKIVLAHCGTGKKLGQAIKSSEAAIIADFDVAKGMKKKLTSAIRRNPKTNTDQYDANHFEVLEAFYTYILSGYDEHYLDGIHYREAVRNAHFQSEDYLEWVFVKKPHDVYKNVPTVFLDATASETVVNRVFPNVPFTKMIVEQSSDVEIYQLEGTSTSKTWLKSTTNEAKIISRIKEILNQDEKTDKRVGLITYKKLGKDSEYYKNLSEKVGAKVSGYFGNMRGRNAFEDVDYLFVVGRSAANGIDHERFSRAVFNHEWLGDKEYVDQYVAMQDGSTMSLNAHRLVHSLDYAVYRHCSTHETIQAIGRARPIFGKKKKVYLFSNESLGEDVRMTGFFQLQSSPYQKQIKAIAAQNHVDWHRKEDRYECGITDHIRTRRKDDFFKDAIDNGLEVVFVQGKDTNRHYIEKTFITANTELLVTTLEAANTNVFSVQSYSKVAPG